MRVTTPPKPLIFRVPYSNRPFYVGEISPTVTTSHFEANNFVLEPVTYDYEPQG